MTKQEFRDIRLARGETKVEFARSLGLNGSDNNVARLIRRIEKGEKPITPVVALRAMELRPKEGA